MNLLRPRTLCGVLLLAFLIVATPAAFGQSGIAGVVKDSTGAVLPGVQVDVSSPVLIEGTRTTISDEAGLYNIVNLRPGEYSVTFTLPGFKVVKREGIMLPTAFTATVNAELAVGGVEESVTVEGESPLVDVRNSLVETVMNREVRDTIPTGRDPFSVGQLIPGVTTSTPDVAGTQIMQQPTLQVHGSSGNDNVYMVDSVQIQHIGFGGNQTGFYFNDGLMSEVSYQTNSLQAEAPVGGVQINMIPQEGGNSFHGSLFLSGANNGMQARNNDSSLVALGFKKENAVKSLYDINATVGGPIAKDRLWFFYTVRRWSANNYLGNTFASNGSQAVDDQHITDNALRLTYQLTKRNKIALHYDRNEKWRGHRPNNWVSASINDPISDVVQTTQVNYIGEAKWTSTVSNRLLIENSIFSLPVNYTLGFEPGVPPNALAIFDSIQSTISGVAPRSDRDSAQMFTYAGNMSYVTGAHAIKVGYQVRTGWSQELFRIPGDILQITNNGVPNTVRLVNTPSGHKEDGTNTGIYVQDSWHLRRFTINPGLRYDRFTMGIPAQSAPAGRWVGARDFAAQEGIVNWNNVSPRIGISWDVNGNGLTAIKASVSRYDRLEGITLVQPLNLRNISFKTCPWDGSPITDNFDQSKCSGAFTPTQGYVDSNLKRPHQWEYTASIQRQVGSNTSVSFGYYGRQFGDLYSTVNALNPSSAYTPVTITNPLTNEPLTVYNLDPALRTSVKNVVQTVPDLTQKYNGVEFQVNTRLSKVTAFGGFTIGKSDGDTDSGDLNNPNVRINNHGNLGFDSTYQVRSGFAYHAPLGMQFSGSIREATGLPQTRTFTVNSCNPSVAGNCTKYTVPNLGQVTQSVKVASNGTYRYPWVNLLDLRFVKVFQTERLRMEPTLDLYNVFNNNAITSRVTTISTPPAGATTSPADTGRPSAIVMGRILRVGFHMTF